MRGVQKLLAALLSAALIWSAASAVEAETTQQHGIRIRFSGRLEPQALPRHGTAPASVSLASRITPTSAGALPQLRRISIAINSVGHLDSAGLPRCRIRRIQPATSAEALASCRGALVGHGHFSADLKLPAQSPFPAQGQVLAFNGRFHDRPAVLAQIYGTEPAPTSFVLPFVIHRRAGGFGTVLESSLPALTGSWGYVTGVSLDLHRTFRRHGRLHSYLSAGCPAPAGFTGAVFSLAQAEFRFADVGAIRTTLTDSCRVALGSPAGLRGPAPRWSRPVGAPVD
jgi:hypothetical protein